MIDNLLQIIAPHYCYSCQKLGSPLCDNCKYDITSESFVGCIVCRRASVDGICSGCQTYYQKAWCVGERHDILEALINAYKFERVRAAHIALADLLDTLLPVLPPETIIVTVPTIPAHIRQRGYDHTVLMARRLAKTRALSYHPLLMRTNISKQRGASRKERFAQAEGSFVSTSARGDVPHLIIDDVVTTGATLQYAAKALSDAGAQTVWVAAIARQPLDKHA